MRPPKTEARSYFSNASGDTEFADKWVMASTIMCLLYTAHKNKGLWSSRLWWEEENL